jgi:hypothetical protein
MATLLGCGGKDDGSSAEDTVRRWGDAVNDRRWDRACALSAGADGECQRKLRRDFGEARLTFEGPAVNGGGTEAGQEYFSFGGDAGTVFVTALPDGDEFRVRVEAVIGQ